MPAMTIRMTATKVMHANLSPEPSVDGSMNIWTSTESMSAWLPEVSVALT